MSTKVSMMNKEQFLLLKLAEECMEVAQRCSKQIQFGSYEIQNTATHKSELNNGERTKAELLDLFSIVHLLMMHGALPSISDDEKRNARFVKKQKLQKYLDYSASIGVLPEIKL
jgi:NTP pyrophosphatase (non-canonical NTP hydrolase)